MKKVMICLVFLLMVISCKNDNSSSDEGFSLGKVFEGKRVLQKELTKEGGLFYYDGKPFTGVSYEMYDEKKMKWETTYAEGRENGIKKYWYENGQLAEEYYKKDGKNDGKFFSWYRNGQPEKELTLFENLVTGLAKYWYENGQQKSISNYIVVKEKILVDAETSADDGPIKEIVIDTGTSHNISLNIGNYKEWFDNGQLAMECNFNNKGELDGLQTRWYQSGRVYERINFKKNKKVGLIQRWYESGEMAYEQNTSNEFIKEWWEGGILKNETVDIEKSVVIRHYSKEGIQSQYADTISGYNSN